MPSPAKRDSFLHALKIGMLDNLSHDFKTQAKLAKKLMQEIEGLTAVCDLSAWNADLLRREANRLCARIEKIDKALEKMTDEAQSLIDLLPADEKREVGKAFNQEMRQFENKHLRRLWARAGVLFDVVAQKERDPSFGGELKGEELAVCNAVLQLTRIALLRFIKWRRSKRKAKAA
ncbi:MAG: hypothetical protein ACFBRM_15495 [Pikeienuella sp.]